MLKMLRWLVFTSLCATFAATSHAQSLLHTSEEIIPNALLVQLNDKSEWAFDVGGKLKTVDHTDMVRWGAWPGSLQKSAVWLSDGSWLAGRVEFQSSQELLLHSDWFQAIKISLRSVRGIVIMAPASINAWNRLQSQLEGTAGGRDTLWLTGNRQIAGVLRIEVDEFERSPRYVLENAGQTISVEAGEVQAVLFSPTLFGKIPSQSKPNRLGYRRRFATEHSQVQPKSGPYANRACRWPCTGIT